MIEREPDRTHIPESGDLQERVGMRRRVHVFRGEIDAFRTIRRDRVHERDPADDFSLGAAIDQQLHHLGITGGSGLYERRVVQGWPGNLWIRPTIEQQFYHRRRSMPGCRHEQRGSAVIGPCIYIGARLQQHPGLLEIGCRPHQSGCVCIVALVRVGAFLQQLAQCSCIRIQNGVHERRRAFRPASVEELWIFGDELHEGLAIARAQCVGHGDGLRIHGR